MRTRHRPDPAAPASRVEAVLGHRVRGWVPDLGTTEAAGEPVAPRVERAAAQPDLAPVAARPPSSWAPALEPEAGADVDALPPLRSPLAALRAGRLDPGRRGAIALAMVAVVAALVAGAVALRGRPQEVVVPRVEQSGQPLPGSSAQPGSTPVSEVVVSVAGKVRRPGLVRLPGGSRVDDAVRAAGGVLPGSDPGLLNLARKLVDGEQVLVGIAGPAPAAGGAGGSASGLVDLNAATASDLDGLPGIGPVLAERIVEWRTENGPFGSVDQLREVPGIGEAKYASLKSKVTV